MQESKPRWTRQNQRTTIYQHSPFQETTLQIKYMYMLLPNNKPQGINEG